MNKDQWLTLVYRNETWVTQLDGQVIADSADGPLTDFRLVSRGSLWQPSLAEPGRRVQARPGGSRPLWFRGVSPTLLTNDREQARAFSREHGRVIYKPLRATDYHDGDGQALTVWVEIVSAVADQLEHAGAPT